VASHAALRSIERH